MALAQGQSFGAESPVGRYWLANCVGFRVEASRGRRGIVERVGCDPAGTDVLLVRPRSVMNRRLVAVPFERVASVDPWEETIVLAPRPGRAQRPAREPRALPAVRHRGAQVGGRLLPVGVALAVAGRRMFQVVFVALRSGAVQLLAMLARLGAFVRRRMPGAREALARIARTMLLFATAYASEIRRVVKAEWTEFAVWLAARRRGPEPDGPPVVELLPPADSEPDAAAEAARRRTG
jgi:hypothetical protein